MHDTKKLLQLIKRAAVEVYRAEKPSDVRFGRLESVQPLRLSVDGLSLSGSLVCALRGVDLHEGAAVVCLRKAGGQKYIVLGETAL